MHALSASDILSLWEVGQRRHTLDKALLLLTVAWPTLSPAALHTLTIGQRNQHLLWLRLKTLGPQASCQAKCPACSEQLEFTLDTRAMLPTEVTIPSEPGEQTTPVYTLTVGTFHLHFRVPTCQDLSTAVHLADLSEGHALLLERCVLEATQAGEPRTVTDLPEEVLWQLTEEVVAHDPLAEIELALSCPACQQAWTILFDVVSFFWAELDVQARRLLSDVHAIASAYGWREGDILALSATRRKLYRELMH